VGHTSRSLITVDTYLDRPAAEAVIDGPAEYYARAARLATDAAAVAERGREAGRNLGDDPAGFVDALVARVLPRVDRDDDPVIETIGGGMLLSRYLLTRTFELVVHGLDIARAARRPNPDYSEALLTEVATTAAEVAVRSGHGPEVILALTGRQPLPTGFSIV
jgi:hypothetical protein